MSGYTDIAWLQYELEKLRAELAKKSAEIERLKTVPMMYRRMAFNAQLQDENNELHQQLAAKDEVIAEAGEMLAMRDRQLAALKAELREICAAIDDPACDLTLTTVECIKKLKAERDELRRDAERCRRLCSLAMSNALRTPTEDTELNLTRLKTCLVLVGKEIHRKKQSTPPCRKENRNEHQRDCAEGLGQQHD